jgi:predicted amidohydrolase YtcJ
MLDAGLTVALSSDAPVVESDDPLLGMSAAITRRTAEGETIAPGQAITAEEALWAYTMGGAIASGDEANRGSLAIGKWADFAVLSANPLTVPPEELPGVRVEQTWLGGTLVHERAA